MKPVGGGGGLYKFGRLARERERQENQTGLTQSVQGFWYSLRGRDGKLH